jgi:hypothetical protein
MAPYHHDDDARTRATVAAGARKGRGFGMSAGEPDRFLVLANPAEGGGLTSLGCYPTQRQAEALAQLLVQDALAKRALVLPVAVPATPEQDK